MMEEVTHNQKQYLKARHHKTKCRYCRREIIWMRSVDSKNIPVDPLKVIDSTPGRRIMGEDGVIMVDTDRKIGWRIHDCQEYRAYMQRRMGSMSLVRDEPVQAAKASIQPSLF